MGIIGYIKSYNVDLYSRKIGLGGELMLKSSRLKVSIRGIELKIGDTFNNTINKLKKLSEIDDIYRRNGSFENRTVTFPQGGSETEYRLFINGKEFLRLIFAQGINMDKKRIGYVNRLVSIEVNAYNWLIGRAQCIVPNVNTFEDAVNVFKEYGIFYKGSNKIRKEYDIKYCDESMFKQYGNGALRCNIKDVEGYWIYSVNIESKCNYLGYMTDIAIYANEFKLSSNGEIIRYR